MSLAESGARRPELLLTNTERYLMQRPLPGLTAGLEILFTSIDVFNKRRDDTPIIDLSRQTIEELFQLKRLRALAIDTVSEQTFIFASSWEGRLWRIRDGRGLTLKKDDGTSWKHLELGYKQRECGEQVDITVNSVPNYHRANPEQTLRKGQFMFYAGGGYEFHGSGAGFNQIDIYAESKGAETIRVIRSRRVR